MKKGTRIVKKLLALFLVVLMSINTFAAVVGDNDGAAFITKAEFDSLKNDFQSQLDTYNSSIDNKIDGAIASYLSGINIAKKKDIKLIIPDYHNMRWQANWKLYGKYKEWTGWNTFMEYAPDIWFTPHFADQRFNARAMRIRFSDVTSHQNGAFVVAGSGLEKAFKNAMRGQGGSPGQDGQPQAPPVASIRLVKNAEGVWVLAGVQRDLFYFWWCCPGILNGTPRGVYGSTGSQPWEIQGTPILPDPDYDPWFVPQSDPNSIIKYTVYWERDGGTEKGSYTQRMTLADCNFPYSYAGSDMYGDHGYTQTSTLGQQDQAITDVQSLLDRGVHWDLINTTSYNSQVSSFYWMMLGKDNNQNVNVLRQVGSMTSYAILDVTGSTNFGTITYDIDSVALNQPEYYSSHAGGRDAVSFDFDVNVPTLPLLKLGNLTNGLWTVNGEYLKIGQGLPLILNATENGYLQISFDYDVLYTLDGLSKNKKINFSIKNADYTSTSGDYISGYLSHDDPYGSAVPATHQFKDYNYESSTGNIKLTIPIKKEESLWFRMAPQNESGGYYATMNNLKISLITK